MNDDAHRRFEELLRSHQGIVFKVARTYCASVEDRRDLVQEIVEQLWRSFGSYDGRRAFSTWAYRVALNVAISSVRKSGLRTHHASSLAVAEEPSDAPREPDERVQALQRAFAQLAALDRALLMLYLDDHSQRDIGEILGISETNVATKINRLKQRLRRDVVDAGFDGDERGAR